MASTTCWDCGKTAHMTPVDGSASVKRSFFRDRVMGCFRCDACRALNIAVASGMPSSQDPLTWLAKKKNPEWHPRPPRAVPVKSFPDVPPEIAAAASEAYRCRMVSNANRAAVLMARSVIEATAKDKGIKTGKLIDKIDKMLDLQLIRPHIRDGAHEVRHLGNDMAHGDFVQAVSAEDTNLVLTLMAEVLDDVYQSPARVAKAQAAREARKESEARLAAAFAEGKALSPAVPPAGLSALRAASTQTLSTPPAQIG